MRGTAVDLEAYCEHLLREERSPLTIEKYMRDIRTFFSHMEGRALLHEEVLGYKQYLVGRYKPTSVNSMLAALNGFFQFTGRAELRVKPLKIQKNTFAAPERILLQAEYKRLLHAANQRQNQRLCLVMQTICATGIRVSELRFITVESLKAGQAEVTGKGKQRLVFLVPKLVRQLELYRKQQRITSGSIFLSRTGCPLNRHQIWADMKTLCEAAQVDKKKVFPHNLRHLFARTFYALEKDLGRLADILGHSNVNTTRIYTMDCGIEHMRLLRRMPLLI